MSITSLSSNHDRICKNSFRRKNDSGEIDVFEAARYFSEINPGPENENGLQPGKKSGSRLSLDMPIMIRPNSMNPGNVALDRGKSKGNKKLHKQPSSPGGKLISSFINSIFNQTASKKKKKSKSGGPNTDQTDQSTGEKRSSKRRSSISHFRVITTNGDSKSSDFYAKTPTKSSYKELLRRYPDLQKPEVFGPGNIEDYAEKQRVTCFSGLDEKSRFGNRDFGLSSRDNNPTATIWADEEKNKFRKFRAVDDDGDSDSSSDLFDLPINNDEFDFYTSGLPVYGTTHIDRIRIGALV